MDHLPKIKDPSYPPPKVPCPCRSQDYDGFRIGGLELGVQDFIQSNDEESFVTTAALRGYLDKLATGAENIQQEVCHQRQKMVRDCLKEVFGFLEIYWDTPFMFGRWNISSALSLDVIMSIVILGETLKNAALQIWPTILGPSPLRQVYTAKSQNPLQDRFREHNWCPNQVMMLFKELDITGLYLASLLKRPFMQAVRHEKCRDEECVALHSSESNYEIKHTDECPQDAFCIDIVIEQSKILSILYGGGIPIIYVPIFPEDRSPPKAEVFDYNSNRIEYVAFSHVWMGTWLRQSATKRPSFMSTFAPETFDRQVCCTRKVAILKGICSAFPQFQSRDRTFATLAHAVQYRSTSKKDEAICLAPIIGLEHHQLSAVVSEDTAERRMQKLYTCIEQIPASILFNDKKNSPDKLWRGMRISSE